MKAMLAYDIRRYTPSDIWEHLPFLYETACDYRRPDHGPVIIELGVRTGNSTSAFLAAAGDDGRVWSVDIEKPKVPASWYENPAWIMTIGDDMNPAVSAVIAEGTYPGADVLFIDSSHEYAHTLLELETYVSMVRPGGAVLMHDTELIMPDMTGMGTARRPHDAQEVARALDTYCEGRGLTWENRPGCCGLGVINIPNDET